MRLRGWSAAAWTALAGGCVPACVDLFHSTGDIRTACEIDASACAEDAASPSMGGDASSLCLTPDAAWQRAKRACAWLGACASPMGLNAFASCMVQAMMVFDCAANPNHVAIGSVRDLWACLKEATTCAMVQNCLFPRGVPPCSVADTTSCGEPSLDGGSGATVRIECGSAASGNSASGPALAGEENCGLWGSVCVSDGGPAACGATAGLDCAYAPLDICPTTQISWCGPNRQGVNQAAWTDCAGNGAGRCSLEIGDTPAGFPPDAQPPQWVSCVPSSETGEAGACTPSLAVTCQGGVAQSCPTGQSETIDCASILGQPGNPSACNATFPLDPPFDWTTPCALLPSQCDTDTCDGSVLTSCARGASFSVDCHEENLGDCQMTSTDLQTQMHSKCTLLSP